MNNDDSTLILNYILENNIDAMVDMVPLLRYEISTNCRLKALEDLELFTKLYKLLQLSFCAISFSFGKPLHLLLYIASISHWQQKLSGSITQRLNNF